MERGGWQTASCSSAANRSIPHRSVTTDSPPENRLSWAVTAEGDRNVVASADLRHDLTKILFTSAVSVKPYDQRIGIVFFIVSRNKDGAGFAGLSQELLSCLKLRRLAGLCGVGSAHIHIRSHGSIVHGLGGVGSRAWRC
jgi:hypothetical protein